jgi:hypothetical protein
LRSCSKLGQQGADRRVREGCCLILYTSPGGRNLAAAGGCQASCALGGRPLRRLERIAIGEDLTFTGEPISDEAQSKTCDVSLQLLRITILMLMARVKHIELCGIVCCYKTFC